MAADDERMMDLALPATEADQLTLQEATLFAEPDFLAVQTAIQDYIKTKIQHCNILQKEFIDGRQPEQKGRVENAVRDAKTQIVHLDQKLRRAKIDIDKLRTDLSEYRTLGVPKSQANSSGDHKGGSIPEYELLLLEGAPVMRVWILNGTLRTQLRQPDQGDLASAQLHPTILTKWVPSPQGAPRKTFVLLSTVRTRNIILCACDYFLKKINEFTKSYLEEHPELEQQNLPLHYNNFVDKRALEDPQALTRTGNLVDVLVYQEGRFNPENTDSMLLIAQKLADGKTEFREVVSGDVFEYGTFGKNDIIIWLDETTHRNLWAWHKELIQANKDTSEARKLAGKEERAKQAMRSEGDGMDDDSEDVDSLANALATSTVGGVSKKRRRNEEEKDEGGA
ncbi:hypothetical protein SCAR479_08710 [Seiridium cardinale]|uniref:Uncharacterized protein n=1 Tax=Seiridium cardinale TaxID=138064 RepID=A0ABR2XLW7_9PEZI